MDSVYIETSIVSYASAWASRDIETAARQQQARDWWTKERHKFEIVPSVNEPMMCFTPFANNGILIIGAGRIIIMTGYRKSALKQLFRGLSRGYCIGIDDRRFLSF